MAHMLHPRSVYPPHAVLTRRFTRLLLRVWVSLVWPWTKMKLSGFDVQYLTSYCSCKWLKWRLHVDCYTLNCGFKAAYFPFVVPDKYVMSQGLILNYISKSTSLISCCQYEQPAKKTILNHHGLQNQNQPALFFFWWSWLTKISGHEASLGCTPTSKTQYSNMLLTTCASLFNKEDLIRAKFWKLLSHESSHLFVVLDLVLKNDSVGSLGLLPCQRHSVSSDVLGLNGGNWRGSWNKRKITKRKS